MLEFKGQHPIAKLSFFYFHFRHRRLVGGGVPRLQKSWSTEVRVSILAMLCSLMEVTTSTISSCSYFVSVFFGLGSWVCPASDVALKRRQDKSVGKSMAVNCRDEVPRPAMQINSTYGGKVLYPYATFLLRPQHQV